MADDNDAGVAGEVAAAEAPVATTEPKKRRGPRSQKVVADAVVSASPEAAAKAPKTRKKRGEKVEAKPVAVEAPAAAKRTRTVKAAAPAKKAVAAPVAAGDDISDLLQLEEENKGLRKALAEKLRAENADLRKRLGQA